MELMILLFFLCTALGFSLACFYTENPACGMIAGFAMIFLGIVVLAEGIDITYALNAGTTTVNTMSDYTNGFGLIVMLFGVFLIVASSLAIYRRD